MVDEVLKIKTKQLLIRQSLRSRYILPQEKALAALAFIAIRLKHYSCALIAATCTILAYTPHPC